MVSGTKLVLEGLNGRNLKMSMVLAGSLALHALRQVKARANLVDVV